MKLSEMTTDKALDALCEMTPYINNIISDELLVAELKSKVKGEGLSRSELLMIGADKINKLVPIIMKVHRNDIYGMLSALNSQTAEEISKQNVMKIATQIRDIVKDKELVDFFKSCAAPERSE